MRDNKQGFFEPPKYAEANYKFLSIIGRVFKQTKPSLLFHLKKDNFSSRLPNALPQQTETLT